MRRAKVLIVDDSVTVRRMVHDLLSQYDEFELVGVAPNGRVGVAKALLHRPDLMVMDVEMPVMTGLQALDELRQRSVDTKVVMFSSLTAEGASTSLEAMARGAAHCVGKPRGRSREDAERHLKEELVPVLQALFFDAPRQLYVPTYHSGLRPNGPQKKTTASSSVIPMPSRDALRSPAVPRAAKRHGRPPRIDAVVIGTSTGGPNALGEVIPHLSGDFPVPVLVVQHMPPVFTRLLAERLDSKSALHVVEASAGAKIQAGTVIIAPGDYHLAVDPKSDTVQLNQGPPENSCRPAADVLFRSAAAKWGEHLLGVVMTGMGKDALIGSKAIVDAGGEVITQNEETCVVWGMPRHVTQEGLSRGEYPVKEIARAIEDRVFASQARARGAS